MMVVKYFFYDIGSMWSPTTVSRCKKKGQIRIQKTGLTFMMGDLKSFTDFPVGLGR